MANEIGATGSRMLMANLQDQAIQDRANQRRNSALAAMQADNLNRMAMDPDINDKSLSYYAAAQQADPSGIMGRIAGALGTVRGMEAQEKKNQAVADRRQRTNEYMGSALTDMLGRDLTDIEQAMVNDGKGGSILEMSDLKQRRDDADYEKRMLKRKNRRDNLAYKEEQQQKADVKSMVDNYTASLADDNPLKEIMSSSMPDAVKAELITKQMLKNASQAEIDLMFQEIVPILEKLNLDPEAIKLAKEGLITPEMATIYSQKVNAIAMQGEYRDALRDVRDASMRYSQAASQAQEQVVNSIIPREVAEDDLRQEGVEEGPDFQSQVDARHRAMKSEYMRDEKNQESIQRQVAERTKPQMEIIKGYNNLLGSYIKKNPYVAEIHKFQSEENMNRMFPRMQEGDVFQSPNGHYYKVGIGPDGQKIKVEATEDDIKDFRYNLFGIFQQDEEQPIVGADDPINNVPDPGQVNDTEVEDSVRKGTPKLDKQVEEIRNLHAEYKNLMMQAGKKGAEIMAEKEASETGIASFFRKAGESLTKPNDASTALSYLGLNPNKYAERGRYNPLNAGRLAFDKKPGEINQTIIEDLQERILELKKALGK